MTLKERKIEIISCIIRIIAVTLLIIILYQNMKMQYKNAVELCDVTSYYTYMNSKTFCDMIKAEDVKNPYENNAGVVQW